LYMTKSVAEMVQRVENKLTGDYYDEFVKVVTAVCSLFEKMQETGVKCPRDFGHALGLHLIFLGRSVDYSDPALFIAAETVSAMTDLEVALRRNKEIDEVLVATRVGTWISLYNQMALAMHKLTQVAVMMGGVKGEDTTVGGDNR